MPRKGTNMLHTWNRIPFCFTNQTERNSVSPYRQDTQ